MFGYFPRREAAEEEGGKKKEWYATPTGGQGWEEINFSTQGKEGGGGGGGFFGGIGEVYRAFAAAAAESQPNNAEVHGLRHDYVDFEEALQRQNLIEAIFRSSETGETIGF